VIGVLIRRRNRNMINMRRMPHDRKGRDKCDAGTNQGMLSAVLEARSGKVGLHSESQREC
jgi:hypothetical protein